ncbi:TPA: hypothetical protein ACX3DJ_004214 [Vibrio parahaemolyticus]
MRSDLFDFDILGRASLIDCLPQAAILNRALIRSTPVFLLPAITLFEGCEAITEK